MNINHNSFFHLVVIIIIVHLSRVTVRVTKGISGYRSLWILPFDPDQHQPKSYARRRRRPRPTGYPPPNPFRRYQPPQPSFMMTSRPSAILRPSSAGPMIRSVRSASPSIHPPTTSSIAPRIPPPWRRLTFGSVLGRRPTSSELFRPSPTSSPLALLLLLAG